jgi:hypothetical protein
LIARGGQRRYLFSTFLASVLKHTPLSWRTVIVAWPVLLSL